MKVALKGTFGKDEREFNGLEAKAKELMDKPLERLVIVAVVERSKITIDDTKGGEATPTVRLVHVEVMEGKDAATAKNMLEATFRRRTGRSDGTPRPLWDDVSDDDEPGQGPDATAGPWPGDADYSPPDTPGNES